MGLVQEAIENGQITVKDKITGRLHVLDTSEYAHLDPETVKAALDRVFGTNNFQSLSGSEQERLKNPFPRPNRADIQHPRHHRPSRKHR